METIPDQPKTVLIPVKVDDKGRLCFLYGGDLPGLAPGDIGDLVVSKHAVTDKRLAELLDRRETVDMLGPGTILHAEVVMDPKQAKPLGTLEPDIQKAPPGIGRSGSCLVMVKLVEPLQLRIMGTKKGELSRCKCIVPALGEKPHTSLNQAFIAISTMYEKGRSTHTGNVFERFYLRRRVTDGKDRWYSLESLRDNLFHEAIEYPLFIYRRPWWYRLSVTRKADEWAVYFDSRPGAGTLYFIDRVEKAWVVQGEHRFAGEQAAEDWLKHSGFLRFTLDAPLDVNPPMPPYKGINGQVVHLPRDEQR